MKTITAIVETPRGSAQKYDYDPKNKWFELSKIMPAGMVFPFDFGFIPNTKGEDGDPLDIIIISELKSFPGCVMKCRIIGAITAEQTEKGETVRNDRFLAVPEVSQIFSARFTFVCTISSTRPRHEPSLRRIPSRKSMCQCRSLELAA